MSRVIEAVVAISPEVAEFRMKLEQAARSGEPLVLDHLAWSAGLHAAITGAGWRDYRAGDAPPSDGEARLVMLVEDNRLGYSHRYAQMAWYGVYIGAPNAWTIDDEDVTADVTYWQPLPLPPECEKPQ